MASVSYTKAKALQDYIRKYYNQFTSELYLGAKTQQAFELLTGVKDEIIVTQLVINQVFQAKLKGWNPINTLDYAPRTLKVEPFKMDMSITADEYETLEKSYLGMMRKPGQDPTDIPFQGMIMDKVSAKGAQEIEIALWQGEKAVSSTAGDALTLVMNGGHKLITDAVTATTITDIATGALTTANALPSFEAMADSLNEAVRSVGFKVYCNQTTATKYLRSARSLHGDSSWAFGSNGEFNILGMESQLIVLPGMKTDAVLMMPEGNGFIGVDGIDDPDKTTVQQNRRDTEIFSDAKAGIQFGILADGFVAVNDQH